ncbi:MULTISPECIES: Imm10 family immunity protein [unclassified Streptomyces]|uniref:Imm10 family immunity protein n=1 Tax=unclassified Streptomyces TaxID=2593676 RepID=UPI0037AD494B
MAEPGVPYWTIRHLESGESVPGQTFTVFIAEGDSGEARYFDLQRMIEEPGQQEIDLELDSYCIVSEGDGVDYGGLEEATLLPGRLILQFRSESAEELELPSRVITLGIAPGIDIDELRTGLKRVLTYGAPSKVPVISLT